MRLSLRNRLLAVALLGIFSCAVALYGLARILQSTVTVRFERARDAVAAELALMKERPSASTEAPSVRVANLGMRGGYVDSDAAFDNGDVGRVGGNALDLSLLPPLAGVLHAAGRTHEASIRDVDGTEPVQVVGAAEVAPGRFAWVVYSVHPPMFLGAWRFITGSLTIATLLLVSTAFGTVIVVRRGAAMLNAALSALASDLGSPVPRPPVPELADLAEHIERLAGQLARSQEDRERLLAELAQRDRLAALGRVAAGVAHEVRNPLAAIKLRVDLGRMRRDTPAQLAGELASVSDEVTRLDRLVADLLVVAGRRVGSRASASLGELVGQRAELLAPWAREHHVSVEVAGSATCTLDKDAVSRAVDNLVRNAVEAAPEGSKVDIEIDEDEDQGRVRVRVLDRGPGVDEGRVGELFEPFFTTKPTGTGLGLALSRAVATAHGGNLTYGRRDGVTCFELWMPRGADPKRARDLTA